MKERVLFFCLCLTLFISWNALAVSQTSSLHLNIQVTNSSGSIIPASTHDFKFTISSTSACNDNLYSETFSSVRTDDRGVVSFYLTDIPLYFSEKYYLKYERDGTQISCSLISVLNTGTSNTFNSIMLTFANGTKIYYLPTENTDISRGNALKDALETATTGNAGENGNLLISDGIFDISNNTLILPPNFSIRGTGPSRTVIVSNISGVFTPAKMVVKISGGDTYIGHLTIKGTGRDLNNPVALPLYTSKGGNIVLDTIEVIGRSDAIYFEPSENLNLRAYNIKLYSDWDTIVLFPQSSASISADFYNLDTIANATNEDNDARPIIISSPYTNLRIFDGKITAIGTNVGTGRETVAVQVSDGKVELHGGVKISTIQNSANSAFDLKQTGGTLAIGTGTEYFTNKTTGTISYLSQNSIASFYQLILSALDGTSPFTTTSTTKVSNLNADFLDGYSSSDFCIANTNISVNNIKINNLAGAGNAVVCVDSQGNLYRGTSTGCP